MGAEEGKWLGSVSSMRKGSKERTLNEKWRVVVRREDMEKHFGWSLGLVGAT